MLRGVGLCAMFARHELELSVPSRQVQRGHRGDQPLFRFLTSAAGTLVGLAPGAHRARKLKVFALPNSARLAVRFDRALLAMHIHMESTSHCKLLYVNP